MSVICFRWNNYFITYLGIFEIGKSNNPKL